MTARQRLGGALRALDRRSPQPLRRVGRSAARRALRRPRGRLVTVVVTASDEDAEYLDEALASVRGQSHRSLQILVVPHGSSVKIEEKVREQLPDDYRLRLVRGSAPTRAEARERGATLARGEYLCFLQGQDVLPLEAVEVGVNSLERTGSDLAVGRMDAAASLSPSVLPPYDPVHQVNRPGVSLREFPMAITDAGLGNRLFRASFWRRSGLSFRGVAQGDTELAMLALRRADRFDVLAEPTYTDMNRAHGTPVEQLYDFTADLAEWIEGSRATGRQLATLDRVLHDHWTFGILDTQMQTFLGDAERMSAEQWSQLREFARSLTEQMSDELWAWVRAESRVKLTLLLDDHREQLEEFVAARWFERDNVATTAVDGEIRALLPFHDSAELAIPPSRFAMHPPETPARVDIRGVRTLTPDRIAIDLAARIELLDLAGTVPAVEARLVPEKGEPMSLPVRHAPDPIANQTVGHKYQDYRPGGCTIEVDLTALTEGAWHLEVTVTARGVTRSTNAVRLDRRGTAGLLGSRFQPRRHTSVGTAVTIDRGSDHKLVLDVEPDASLRLVSARTEGRRIVLGVDGQVRRLHASCGARRVGVPVRDGVATLELPPRDSGARVRWTIRAVDGSGSAPVAWPDDGADPWHATGTGEVVVARDPRGNVEILEAADTVVIDGVDIIDGAVTVRGRWLGTPPRVARLSFRGDRHTETQPIRTEDGAFAVTFSTRWNEWGLAETAIPTGEYLFGLGCGPLSGERPGRLMISTAYAADMLRFTLTSEFRMRPVRTGAGTPGVYLAPPVPLEHAGAYGQHRLRTQCLEGLGPIDPSAVYFSVYAGSSATDSERAIHEELRRTRPDLTLYWGVSSAGSWVPEGGIPVVMNTPEWYQVLSTAKYLVQNIDFDRWWRKRPGQKFLQTFHGYPAKSMGLRMWVAKNFTQRRLQDELDRTMAGWDLILTPAPEMDVHYRTEYAYEGPILNQGYPRDDALVQPTAAEDRERTRRLLGIRPDQKVVLYAPTWRDHLALNYRSAKMVEHLDVVAASEALGDDYVILLRGHRFNSKGSPRSPRTARLIDVTDYPEINDLILASDAAVLDYSSLRFDFALTGRPMIFLVPDLADYTGGVRGFLFDYADTAPGPMLETAEEVIEALGDLDSLQRAYADRIAAFNAKYQYLQDGKAAARVVEAFFTD